MYSAYSALIPLRGGSKSIPLKNIKILAGKPLCYWVIAAAVKAQFFSEIIISTDCLEIKKTVCSFNLPVRVIDRPADLATDSSSTESVMLHALNFTNSDRLVTIQATSPMLTYQDLQRGRDKFASDNLDSLLTAVRTKRFFWSDVGLPLNYDPSSRPRRQDFAGTLMENGAFYITKRNILLTHRCRLGGKVGVLEMDEGAAAEIDEPADWAGIEHLLVERNKPDCST